MAYKPLPEKELACPNCRGNIVRHGLTYICSSCSASFNYRDGINYFLPKGVEKIKTNENSLFLNEYGSEARVWSRARREPWYLIMVNYFNIRRFEDKILNRLGFEGKVLDLAAGVCWASSLIKTKNESSEVYALDISPASLDIGKRLSGLFNAPLDYLTVADAERLPFREGLFDSVVCYAGLHHFLRLPKALSEIRRVLKYSGVFVSFDSASSSLLRPLLLRTFCARSVLREKEYNIKESLLTFSDWQVYFKQAGFADVVIELERSARYRETLSEKLLLKMLSLAPKLIIRELLASSVILTAEG